MLLLCANIAVAQQNADVKPTVRLRLVNKSKYAVRDLVVMFPESTVQFGTVAAHATTKYQAVPRGVYRYAAYQCKDGDKVIAQFVRDWTGDQPINGRVFTYVIEVPPRPTDGHIIKLLRVVKDR
jgi:hypothetical protein